MLLFGIFYFFLNNTYAQYNSNDSCAFFGNRPIYPYYHPSEPTCRIDFYNLKKEFTKVVMSPLNFEGIITITFFINYLGESKFHHSTFLDLNYHAQPIDLEGALQAELLTTVIINLGNWNPSKDEKGLAINSRKFYTFKFIKGSLVEILPK